MCRADPEIEIGRPRRRGGRVAGTGALVLAVAVTPGVVLPVPSTATVLASVPVARDSTLVFRPLSGAGDRFSVSDLTRRYERDLTSWTNPGIESTRDLTWLDRHGTAWPAPPEADSTDIDVVDEAAPGERTAMTPTEQDAALPPPPPAQAGIPDAVSTALPLIGGLALLIQMIAQMAK